MAIVNYRTARLAASRREPFDQNSSAGFWEDTRESWWTRDVPEEFEAALNDSVRSGDTYVIVSYSTPIAFSRGDTFTMNPRKYSSTTSRQQSYYREALSQRFTEVPACS